jgi:DNA polymerase III gamma/tau subunit
MANRNLATTERPFRWNDLIGNKQTVKTLKSFGKDFPNVVFLVGSSGTGKTTSAYIIAALANDPNPIKEADGSLSPNPKSEESVLILKEQFNRDTSFYDASKMSVEDVRNLTEEANTMSFFGGKRVIIVDEAQELSKAGKGAVLKLLEQQKNSIIILCTMNPESFDSSILSRGMTLRFSPPTVQEIAEHLLQMSKLLISDEEAASIPEDFWGSCLYLIASHSGGSVRQALWYFEQVVKGEMFTEREITDGLGFISHDVVLATLLKLIKRDVSAFTGIRSDVKEFFYQSFNTLSEILLYVRTGYAASDWAKNNFKRFSECKAGVERLFVAYEEINRSMGAYFKPQYALAKLSVVFTDEHQAGATVPLAREAVSTAATAAALRDELRTPAIRTR